MIGIMVLLCSKASIAMQWQFAYDDAGRIVKAVDSAGRQTTLHYELDSNKRVWRIVKDFPDASRVTYVFDHFGRPASMTDAGGTMHYAYDGFNRLTTTHRDGNPVITYMYDTLDRLRSVSVGDRGTIHYAYDFLGRLAEMETPVGRIAYEYHNGQGVIIRTLPNGIRTVWEYRPDGNLASITHVASDNRILAQFAYDYRPDGLINQINELSPLGQQIFKYDYDTVQRLTAVTDAQGGKIEYRYDTVGNRLAVLTPGTAPVASTYDWAGRLLSYNSQPCTHDTAGNLTSCLGRSGKATFDYNGAHLLKTVTTAYGAVHYQYDGDNRLIARTVGKDKTVFVVDPLADSWRPWLAIPPAGQQTFFIWEGETPLAVVTGGEVQFLLHDHLGSVRYLTDRTGRIIQTLDYSPFGEPRQNPTSELLQPGFAGLFFDPIAAVYLTRARAYEPSFGRFLQRDPKMRMPDIFQHDFSAYAYCWGDPINWLDIDGAEPKPSIREPADVSPPLFEAKSSSSLIRGLTLHDKVNNFVNDWARKVPSGAKVSIVFLGINNRWDDAISLTKKNFDQGNYTIVVPTYSGLSKEIDWTRTPSDFFRTSVPTGFPMLSPFGFPVQIHLRKVGIPEILANLAKQGIEVNALVFESGANFLLQESIDGLVTYAKSHSILPRIACLSGSISEEAHKDRLLKAGYPEVANLGEDRLVAALEERWADYAHGRIAPLGFPGYFVNLVEVIATYGPSGDLFRDKFGGHGYKARFHLTNYWISGQLWVHQESAKSPKAAQNTMVSQSLRSLPTKGKQKIIAYGTTEQDAEAIAELIGEFMKNRPGVDYEIVRKWGDANIWELAAMRIAEHADRVLVLRSKIQALDKRKDKERKRRKDDSLPYWPGCIGPDCWGGPGGSDVFGNILTGDGGPPDCRGPDCWGGPGGAGGRNGPGGGLGGGSDGSGGSHRFSPLSPSNVGGIYLRGAGTVLDGLGPLEGVAVDAHTGKLVLLSQQQGPIKLPPLRLDDIVTIFRSVYEYGDAPWVSIDPDPHDPHGPLMHVRHGPGTANTYVGWVLFEADRIMKAYSLGSDNISRQPLKSTVQDYRNLLDLGFANFHGEHTQPIWERFWIVPAAVNRQQTTDKHLTLVDVPLKVNTQRMELRNGKLMPAANPQPSRQAQTFSRWFSEHYEDIAREALVQPPGEGDQTDSVAPYAELHRIVLVAAIAEALRDQGVPLPAWMHDYPVKPVPVAATTPSLLVTGSQSTTRQEVEGGSIKTITETRSQQIYGGVRLSPEDQAVHTTATAPQAEALAPAVAKVAATIPWFVPQSLTVQGKSHQAIALPGNNARDLGAQRLTATDLVVPVQAGRQIGLHRTFHSFFQPVDVFGGAWTLDLPRLAQQPMPVKRSGDTTEYWIVYRLTSPLNTWQASFSKVGQVAELHDAELLIPDTPGELLALGQATIEQIGSPTQVLLFRDGRRWYFEETGQLAGWTEAPLTVVYRRDDEQRIRRIEGWYGKDLHADIVLSYDQQERLIAATGSNGEEVTYSYDPTGAWLHVQGP
jgi:RHS repeat-associated protein